MATSKSKRQNSVNKRVYSSSRKRLKKHHEAQTSTFQASEGNIPDCVESKA